MLPLTLGNQGPFPLTARAFLGVPHLQPDIGSLPQEVAQVLLPRTMSDIWGEVTAHLTSIFNA